ncbi:MAG: hypothetical protein AAFO01_16605, partial [Pseudomonadota bacterium]
SEFETERVDRRRPVDAAHEEPPFGPSIVAGAIDPISPLAWYFFLARAFDPVRRRPSRSR